MRILMFGMAPLPTDRSRHHAAPGIRAWQLAAALANDGHQVHLVTFGPPARPARGEQPGWTREALAPGDFLDADALQRIHNRVRPGAAVAAGSYQPTLAATRIRTPAPLWIDLPGDLTAEAQLRWAQAGDRQHGDDARDVLSRALHRADALSAVSTAQRATLWGQLGLCGRLGARALAHDPVAVIPPCCPPPVDTASRLPAALATLPDSALLVVSSGGFNAWLDVDTLVAALTAAMDREPRIHFAAAGGPIPDMDPGPYDALAAAAAKGPHSDRFHALGWLHLHELAGLYARALAGVCLDRPCPEAHLGARNRLLHWAQHGVPAVVTPLCETARELCDRGAAFPVSVEDPGGVAATLVSLARTPERAREAGRRAREHVAAHATASGTALPLVLWARQPTCRLDPPPPTTVDPAAAQAESRRLGAQLAAIRGSGAFRLLHRAQRMVGRLREPFFVRR